MNLPVLVLVKFSPVIEGDKIAAKHSLLSNACLVLWKRKRNDNSLQEMLFIHFTLPCENKKKSV